ncbi:MAG: oligosaccharide flippase family protein, partial [Candidatus Bathyarchaeota archaeon]|nr:oligosaccharide flippase family protein [Candidatus Bathyarchaeota archaeon]
MTQTDATRIARGSAYLVAERVATMVLRVVAFAFVARTLTEVEMGVRVALTLTLSVALLLSDLGFSGGVAKHIAEYRGRNADYSPLTFSGISLKTLTAGFIAVICAVASQQLSELLLKSGEYAVIFQFLSIYLLLACMNMTMNSLLQGLNKIREMAVLTILGTFTRAISVIALLMYGYGLVGLTMGWFLGDLIYTILSTSILVKGRYVRKHSTREIISHLKMLSKFSWPLFLVGVVVFLYNWFDQAVLLAYVPLSEVALYSVALQAFGVLSLMPAALSTTLLPYYSEQYGKNKHENIVIGVRAATRYISLLYTPLAVGLMITANPVITFFAGSFYARADIILGILSLVGGISGISAALGVLLLVYNMTPALLLI